MPILRLRVKGSTFLSVSAPSLVSATASLELPTELEASCYLLSKRDGFTQREIAQFVGRDQRTVGRCIDRTEEKLQAIKDSGRFDPGELELYLQKLTGRAARGVRTT